jgi:hypothetical protein
MAEPKESTTDYIMASKNTTADTGISAELPENTQNLEPLAMIEAEPVRTRLRTYATLLALYVHDHLPLIPQ